MSEPAVLRSTVGPGQKNHPQDMRLLRRHLNAFIRKGYLPQKAELPEEGGWDQPFATALQSIENTFFYGEADPDNQLNTADTLFQFLVQTQLEEKKLVASLSNEVYVLASTMVPGGIDRIKRTTLKTREMVNGKPVVKKTIQETKITGNIRNYLPEILGAMTKRSLNDTEMLMMALATIRAESASFQPVDEGISRYNTSPVGTKGRHPFDRYDFRPDSLGNHQLGDGALYKGRGFVQLTGRANYEQMGKQLGLNLLDNPDQANEGPAAAAILAQFIKNKEGGIRAALKTNNLVHARKLVNGGTHGLKEFTDAFAAGRKYLRMAIPKKAKTAAKAKP